MATVSKKKKSSKKPSTMRLAPIGDLMDPTAGVRAFAMNAGDLSVFLMQEVKRVMEEQRYNQARAIAVGIDQLLAAGHISRQEAKDLNMVAKHVLRAARKNADAVGTWAPIKALYHKMAMSSASSPVALAITSAANASLREQAMMASMPKGALAKVVGTPGNTGVGAVIGGVLGGVLGSIICGGFGAGVGAGLGAATGAAIVFSNEKGV